MNIGNLLSLVSDRLRNLCPNSPIEVAFGEDQFDCLVHVYSVDKQSVALVEEAVFALNAAKLGLVFTPLVRDRETTKRYYPTYHRDAFPYELAMYEHVSRVSLFHGYTGFIGHEAVDLTSFDLDFCVAQVRECRDRQVAANEELALAA